MKRESTLIFSVDEKSMFPSLRRDEILRIVNQEMGRKVKEGWDNVRMPKALKAVWENGFCKIGGKLVRAK